MRMPRRFCSSPAARLLMLTWRTHGRSGGKASSSISGTTQFAKRSRSHQ